MLKLATKFAPEQSAFQVAFDAGFRCAELWLDTTLLSRWQTIAALARQYPFEYALHFPNRSDLSHEALEQVARLYRELGNRCMVIHQLQCNKYQTALLSLEPGMQLAVENHHLDAAGIVSWATSNSGQTLDVEHFWMLTMRDAPLGVVTKELRKFLSCWQQKVRHVHLPGYAPGFDEHRPMYCSREMVFEVLSLLAEFRFAGLIVSEIDLTFQEPNDLRMDVLLFETWNAASAQNAEAP